MILDVRAVANYLLDKSEEDGLPVDHMKLQKLAYISHGWHLAVCGRPLFFNSIQAWRYGPVIPDLYRELKGYGHKAIDARIKRPKQTTTGNSAFWRMDDQKDPAKTIESNVLVTQVWALYRPFSALQLSAMTHQDGTPWAEARKSHESDIANDLIKAHYLQLAARNRAKRNQSQ